jgi:type II secretory pathway pseudopilin PulG
VTKRVDALRHEAGFTIIEVMVGAMLLVIGLIGTLALFDTSNRLAAQNQNRVGAVNLAREVAEDIRALDYDRVDATNIVGDLAGEGITDGNVTQNGIQITRGHVTYTLNVVKTSGGNTTSPCILDSGTDGARAATDTSFYCNGSPAAGSTTPSDGNPDDFRRVEVTVTWPGPQGTASCSGLDSGPGRSCVTQAVLIQNPSGGIGPSIETITLQTAGLTMSADGTTIEGPETPTNATFTVTTRAAADEVHWTADDGVSSGVATGSNKNWTFTWSFPSSMRDGAHTVSVQAFLLGSGGPAKPKAIQVNRSEPAAPDINVLPLRSAGVNTRLNRANGSDPAVEFTWAQNPETDIRGYRVYHALNPLAPQLDSNLPNVDPVGCSTIPQGVAVVSCVDPLSSADLTAAACTPLQTPPTPTLPCNFTYYIVAFDSRWTTRTNTPLLTCTSPLTVSIRFSQFSNPDRPGCASQSFTIDVNNGQLAAAPGQPQNPGVTRVNGLPVLTWGAASAGSGSAIAFYRIYRSPSNPPQYSERLGRTQNATSLTFTDATASAASQSYAITAVNQDYQESDPVLISEP